MTHVASSASLCDMDDATAAQRRALLNIAGVNSDLFLELLEKKGAHTGDERAELLRMDRRAVHRYATGEVMPGLATARRIANMLGTKVDILWPERADAVLEQAAA